MECRQRRENELGCIRNICIYENSVPKDRETRTGTRLSGGTVGGHCLLGLKYRLCDILVALHKFHCRFCVPDLCILPKRTRCDAVGHSLHVDTDTDVRTGRTWTSTLRGLQGADDICDRGFAGLRSPFVDEA